MGVLERVSLDGGGVVVIRELVPHRFVNLDSAPPDAQAGWIYYDEPLGKLRFYNGTSWVDVPAEATGGGEGPDLFDQFSMKLGVAESLASQSDAVSVSFSFPEAVSVQADAVGFTLAFPDSNSASNDALIMLRITHAETNAALTDALNLQMTFADSNAVQSETVNLRFTLADSNSAPSDNLASLNVTHAESNLAPSDSLTTLRITYSESVAGQTDAFTLRILHAETNAAPTDSLTTLKIVHAETNAAVTDGSSFTLRPQYGDTNAAPTDANTSLRITIGDTVAGFTDSSRGNLVWFRGGVVVAGTTGWVNSAEAAGRNDGINSTLTDTTTDQVSGTITLQAADADSSLNSWTISQARIIYFLSGVFSAATTSRVHLEYRVGTSGSWTTLESIGTDFDDLANGRAYVVPITTWANINLVEYRVRYVAALLVETATLTLDAIHVEATASKNPL